MSYSVPGAANLTNTTAVRGKVEKLRRIFINSKNRDVIQVL
jgi:hypothetical protein